MLGDEGLTVPTTGGSHAFVISGVPGLISIGRNLVSGHELFGHGIPSARGASISDNNTNAVRTENLIRRILGQPATTGGAHHGVTNPNALPTFK